MQFQVPKCLDDKKLYASNGWMGLYLSGGISSINLSTG